MQKGIKDLNLAAFLLASGMQLKKSYWKEGIWFFVFKQVPDLPILTANYWHGHASVDVRKFTEALRFLKDIIHNSNSKHESQS